MQPGIISERDRRDAERERRIAKGKAIRAAEERVRASTRTP